VTKFVLREYVKYTYIVGQSVPSIGNSITEKKFAPIGLDRF